MNKIESARSQIGTALLVLALASGMWLGEELRAQPLAGQAAKVVGRVDHVNPETLRIVVDDRTFQLTPATRVQLPNGSLATVQALRKGVFVEFVPHAGDVRPAIHEIRILPDGFTPPPRSRD